MKIKKFYRRIKQTYQKYRKKLSSSWLEYHTPYGKLRSLYYNLKYGIRNLIIWFPIIWKDRAWDQSYLFHLLEFKFKRMEDQFRNHSLHVGAEKTADRIKTCRLLCNRLTEWVYTTPYDERNKPHFEWFSNKFKRAMKEEPDERGFITIVKRDEPDEPEARWIIPATKHEEMMKQQDVDLLCRIMKKHVRGWWD